MSRVVYEVRAFTADGQNGNPAGVVLGADDLSTGEMQAIATRVGYPETAFVSGHQPTIRTLRFFTPTTEVPLCGHATIASWSLLHTKGLSAGNYGQQTAAGLLAVSISDDGRVFMEQPMAKFYETLASDGIARLLGITGGEFHSSLQPQIVSTGIRDLLVPLRRKAALDRLQPDLEAITSFSRQHDISGLHVFSLLEDDDPMAAARNFAPADGIDEEAATGTSNGALLCYLKANEQLSSNQTEYRIEQGEAMGSLSYIYGKFAGDIIWIGGSAAIIKEFTLVGTR